MMNDFKQCLNCEFKYILRAKILIVLALIFVSISGIMHLLNYQMVRNDIQSYSKSIEFHKKSNTDIESELKKEYQVIDDGNGMVMVDNDLPYHRDMVKTAIYSASPEYSATHALEISLIFLPFLFFIIGTLIITRDQKYKIYKHQVLRFGRMNYFVSKITVTATLMLVSLSFFIAINKIASIILTKILRHKFPIDQFDISTMSCASSIWTKIGIVVLISFMFSMLGAVLGALFKNSISGVILFVIYYFIIPVRFKYDPGNMIANIADKYFDFYGVVKITQKIDFSVSLSFVFISMITVVSVAIMALILQKRSAYN